MMCWPSEYTFRLVDVALLPEEDVASLSGADARRGARSRRARASAPRREATEGK